MLSKIPFFQTIKNNYWPLIKSLQTALLVITGLAGYMSCRCPVNHIWTVMGLTGSLFLTISGSTILNMWYDRDIDAKMKRTCWRPLPAGSITPEETLKLGLIFSVLGVIWSLLIDLRYGIVVFFGLFVDVFIYTIWLKRRTPWSILWGGISGAMPILAGRVLGFGSFDWVGFSLASAILFWIPTHILTFAMRYHEDYLAANVPTLPTTYGFRFTRITIAVSSVISALSMGFSMVGISMSWGYLRVTAVLALGLLGIAFISLIRPSEKLNFGLFKYASLFMLGSMVMIVVSGF